MRTGITITILLTLTAAVALPAWASDAPPKKLKLRDSAPAPAAETPAPAPAPDTKSVAGKTYKDPYTGMEFVFVKGGCYQMGDTFDCGTFAEKPVHEVCVSDIWMGKYEVTQGEWVKVMGENPSKFLKCGEDCPVEQVSWEDTVTFMARMRKNGGKSFRLPTEAEWEYACRSGGKNEKYCGGNTVDDLAWYKDNAAGKTQPVGTKQPNGLGIYDMSGNVCEWCNDWFVNGYYANSPKDNPKGPLNGDKRIMRGGSWVGDMRATSRGTSSPSYRIESYGFRVVFSAQ